MIQDIIPGITLLDLESGERCNIKNPIYESQANYIKQSSCTLYQYLCLRRINKISEFLRYFPKHSDVFFGFRERYKDFIETLHRSYIDEYVKKESSLATNTIFDILKQKIHQHFLKMDRKMPITKKVIYNFMDTTYTPDEILYFMNHDLRKMINPSSPSREYNYCPRLN